MLERLRELKSESMKTKESFKRPFAALGDSSSGKSPVKMARRSSFEPDAERAKSPGFSTIGSPNPHLSSFVPSSSLNSEWSNSSWTEVESQVIGQFKIHPLSNQTKANFIFRVLTPMAEYQDVSN